MAFPTVVQFRAKFPELATMVNDAEVQSMLDTGAVVLQESSWEPADWITAALLWTAHWLSVLADEAMRRSGGISGATDTTSGSSTPTDIYVRMVRYEGKMIAYNERRPLVTSTNASSASWTGPGEESMNSTSYGQQYLKLYHRNFPAIAVI